MVLLLLLRASVPDFFIESQLKLRDPMSRAILRRSFKERQANCLDEKPRKLLSHYLKLCERSVSLAVFPAGKRVRWLGLESPNGLGATPKSGNSKNRAQSCQNGDNRSTNSANGGRGASSANDRTASESAIRRRYNESATFCAPAAQRRYGSESLADGGLASWSALRGERFIIAEAFLAIERDELIDVVFGGVLPISGSEVAQQRGVCARSRATSRNV